MTIIHTTINHRISLASFFLLLYKTYFAKGSLQKQQMMIILHFLMIDCSVYLINNVY